MSTTAVATWAGPLVEADLQVGLAVNVVSEYADFLALETEWNDAVTRAGIPHPFLRHEWVRTWWDAFGGPKERRQGVPVDSATLHILIVRAGAEIVGIAPLMHERTRMYGVPVRRLAFLQNDHTPRTDFIIAGRHGEVYRAIWESLRRNTPRWDVLQLNQLPRESATRQTVADMAAADHCPTGVWASSDSPFLTLTGTWDSYLASLPAKFRSNLRNRMSRLAKIGEPSLEVLTGAAEIAAAADDAWRLEKSGWKEKEGTAITSDPAVHTFYTRLTERAAAAGWLRLLFLKVGDRRVATSYGAVFDGRLFLFKTGYDPEYATGSPFKVLTYLAIEEAYREGLTEVDFLGDTEPWKREWTDAARGHDWLFVFTDSLRAQLLHRAKFRWLPGLKRWRA